MMARPAAIQTYGKRTVRIRNGIVLVRTKAVWENHGVHLRTGSRVRVRPSRQGTQHRTMSYAWFTNIHRQQRGN